MRILRKITFNDESIIEVGEDDIIVLVGPNNVGKSRTLKDIGELCYGAVSTTIVVNSIELDSLDSSAIETELAKHCDTQSVDESTKIYSGYRFKSSSDMVKMFVQDNADLSDLAYFFVCQSDTERRLDITRPSDNIATLGRESDPIHHLAHDKEALDRLNRYFYDSFHERVYPDILTPSHMPLVIGKKPQLDGDYDSEYHRAAALGELFQKYAKAHDQGDGIRSFLGVAMDLMADQFRLYLLDEPEAFLHPPQATKIGHLIAKTTVGRAQVVISTHSKDLILGLLQEDPSRIKIFRMTREGSSNKLSSINSDELLDIWNKPILRHSDILDCLFHDSSVVCESDSDIMLYSAMLAHIDQDLALRTKFVQAGGKERLRDIAAILKNLSVPFIVIPDIDIMNNEQSFRNLVESCGGVWSDIEHDEKVVVGQIAGQSSKAIRREEIQRILDAANAELDTKTLKELHEAIKIPSKWSDAKRYGKIVFRGEAAASYAAIDVYCKAVGIFIVPEGELESFLPDVSAKHGGSWATEALTRYPNLGNPRYDRLKAFVDSWRDQLSNQNCSDAENNRLENTEDEN